MLLGCVNRRILPRRRRVIIPPCRVRASGHMWEGGCVPLDCTLEGKLTWRESSLGTTPHEMNLKQELGCFTQGREGTKMQSAT